MMSECLMLFPFCPLLLSPLILVFLFLFSNVRSIFPFLFAALPPIPIPPLSLSSAVPYPLFPRSLLPAPIPGPQSPVPNPRSPPLQIPDTLPSHFALLLPIFFTLGGTASPRRGEFRLFLYNLFVFGLVCVYRCSFFFISFSSSDQSNAPPPYPILLLYCFCCVSALF